MRRAGATRHLPLVGRARLGVVLILSLVVYVTYNDFVRWAEDLAR